MAFGNRPKRASKQRETKQGTEIEADEELLSWSEKNPGQLQGIVVLGSSILAIGLLLVSAPHTHAGKKVDYNTSSMVEGSLSGGLLPEYKEEAESRLGIDFRRILTPISEEATTAMQEVAKTCLPKNKHKNFVMPAGGSQVHETYGYATDYLICAMTNERSRLCDSRERNRLAEQLLQYRDRRQNLLGIERYQKKLAEKIAKSPAAQYQIKMVKKIRNLEERHKSAPSVGRSIGTDIDPRIMAGISDLVSHGYFSASDFGWLGLFLPEEYVEPLSTDQLVTSCG